MAVDVEPEITEEPAPKQPEPSTTDFDPATGVHYWDEYRAELSARGQESQWDDKYMVGHSAASQFVQPYEGRYAFEWTLKKGQSASEGVQAWLKGLTIADYRSAGVAAEIDEVRDALGDRKFDSLFGSKDEAVDRSVPESQRLKISAAAYTTPIGDQLKEVARQSDAAAVAQPAAEPAADAWQYYDADPEKAEKADDVVQTEQKE